MSSKDNEYTTEVFFYVSSSRSALSSPGNDGQRFAYLQSITHTTEEFGQVMAAFWRRLVDEKDPFPPEVWQLLLQSSLTALGERCRPVRRGMTWMRLITGGTMRQWWPWLEEVNREVGPFGVALSGGVEQVRLRAPGLRETGNWLGITDCSNDVNATNRTVVFGEVANCVPALTPFVAKFYGSARGPVLSGGLGGNQSNPLIQRCPTRRPHGTGNVLSCFATRAKAFHGGLRERRSGRFRIDGRCFSSPYGNRGQHD